MAASTVKTIKKRELSLAREAALHVRLMAFDVDGVMTDGRLFFGPEGEQMKAFHSLDGHGLKMLGQGGIERAIISGRRSEALALRAENLGITELYMGIEDKKACLLNLLKNKHWPPEHVGYMGDDVVDLPILRACGFSAAPADAHPLVIDHVLWVSGKPGGFGAVREVCDFVLDAQGLLDPLHAAYLG